MTTPNLSAPLKAQIAQLNDEIEQLNRKAADRWHEQERAKEAVVKAGKAHDPQSTEAKALKAAADRYQEVVGEVDALTTERDELFRKAAGSNRRRGDVPETKGAWLEAELKNISTVSGAGQAASPVQHFGSFIDRLAPASVALASGVTILPTDRVELKIPHITSDPTAGWINEGSQISPADPGGELIAVRPGKLAALTYVSTEAVRDSELAALGIAEQTLVRASALKLDLAFFEGSGSGAEPEGLKNTAGIQEVDLGGNGLALDDLDPVIDAFALLHAENAVPTAIYMNPRTWKALSKLRELTSGSNKPLLTESAGSPTEGIKRTLLGVPVYLSSQIPVDETQGTAVNASSIWVAEAPQIIAVQRQDAEIAIDPYARFDYDEYGVRVTSRWGICVPNPKAVCRIKGIVPA